MAENTVVIKEQLTAEMIEAGARLIDELDKSGLPVQDAMWFFDSEINEWHLLFASSEVSEKGRRPLLERIYEARKNLGSQAEHVPFSGIRVLTTSEEPVRWIRIASPTGPGISRVRFKKNIANGHIIDDALIYRSAA